MFMDQDRLEGVHGGGNTPIELEGACGGNSPIIESKLVAELEMGGEVGLKLA